MDFNLEVRLKQLESLEQYISSSRDKVQSVLDCLKWNAKDVLKDSQLIKCSENINHRIHKKNADEHVEKCHLLNQGYRLNEEFLSEPPRDNATNSSIIIDHNKKIEILSAAHRSIPNFKSAWNGQDPDPKTLDRFTSTYSSDERFVMYDYAINHTIGPPELPEFNTIQPVKSDKVLTPEEIRMRERDAKRRRIKYKSVHTDHKSQKEVLREVIDSQMEQYREWLIDNNLVPSEAKHEQNSTNISEIKSEHEQGNDDQLKSRPSSTTDISERDNSIISRNSTHSSSSKSTARKHSKERYEYDHNSIISRNSTHSSSSKSTARKHSKERYEYDHRKKHCNDYKRRNEKRRKSREKYEYHKHWKTSSRHEHDHYSYKER